MKTEMRKYLDTEIKPLIPLIVKSQIKPVRKYSFSLAVVLKFIIEEITETEDEIWIPSAKEVFGEGRISYYEKQAVYYSSLFSSDKDTKRAFLWWLRSASNSNNFNLVNTDGSINYTDAYNTGGVALGFCT